MNLSVQTDRTLIRAAAQSTRYVLISFTAPDSQRSATRSPVNIALVIDRSGSMGGSKIELARAAVVQSLRMLHATDRFSVISYDDQVDVLVASTHATPEAVQNATRQVSGVEARGNTDLGAGWLKGCEQIATHLEREGIGRCLLLSDGLANQGITDREELARHADALRQRGVTTSTLGIGADFDELLLEGMSRAGAGHFYYVETPVQIPDILTSELGEALEIVARDVAVTVRAGDGIEVETLNRFPVRREADGTASIRLGDLASGQEVSLVLRLRFPTGREGDKLTAVFGLVDARGVLDAPDTDAVWTFADHAANDAQPRAIVVDRAVAHLYAARAKAEALELNRAGRYDDALKVLEGTARRTAEYAGNDQELLATVDALRDSNLAYSQPMSARLRKSEHFENTSVASMRDSAGKARRRRTPAKS